MGNVPAILTFQNKQELGAIFIYISSESDSNLKDSFELAGPLCSKSSKSCQGDGGDELDLRNKENELVYKIEFSTDKSCQKFRRKFQSFCENHAEQIVTKPLLFQPSSE